MTNVFEGTRVVGFKPFTKKRIIHSDGIGIREEARVVSGSRNTIKKTRQILFKKGN